MTDISRVSSSVFCMAPWTGLHGRSDGGITPCCEIGASVARQSTSTLEEAWNSEIIRDLRVNMLAGKKTALCNHCYAKDAAGVQSLRRAMNNRYAVAHSAVVDSTTPDGYVEKLNLVHWDFRFSNVCNLKCRICSHSKSSTWYDDEAELSNDAAAFKERRPRIMRLVQSPGNFWPYIEQTVGIVENIHWLGGEPLLIDEHWRVLEMLRAANRRDVKLRYFTNLTHLGHRGRDAVTEWRLFDNRVKVGLSIDGMGRAFDYQRSGGKWDTVEANYRRIYQEPHVFAHFHPTISVMNAFAITDLHRYLLVNDLIPIDIKNNPAEHYAAFFVMGVVIHPKRLSLRILPPDAKSKVAEHMMNHADWAHREFGLPKNGYQPLINFMMAEDWQEQLPAFWDYTRKLDGMRSESFLDVFPEWRGLLQPPA